MMHSTPHDALNLPLQVSMQKAAAHILPDCIKLQLQQCMVSDDAAASYISKQDSKQFLPAVYLQG